MRTVVITPADPVVTLEEANAHLKRRDSDEDDLIETYIAAATAHIDGPDGWLGRAIGVQTLEARYDAFCTNMRLPYPEIIEIQSISYVDGDGVIQTAPTEDYDLFGSTVAPALGKSWPSPRTVREAVRIRYDAGYQEVPEPIRAAILLMVGDLHKQRETFVNSTISSSVAMSTTVDNLLSPFRVWI